MNDNHWYPRDPARYLTDTAWCDAATEVAHNRLIETYYALGKPIKDDQSRIQLIGKIKDADYARVRGNLAELGWRFEGGELRHKRIEETMAEADEKRRQHSEAGKAAAAARWSKPDVNATAMRPYNERIAAAILTTTTTTDTTTDTETTKAGERASDFPEIPSWGLVKAHADRTGLAEWKARDWFNEMEGCGWRDYRGRQVCKWTALVDRVRTRWEADGRPMKQPGHVVTTTAGKTQPAPQGGAGLVILGKEYERILEKMKTLKQTYGDHQTWTPSDQAEFMRLKVRKLELKKALGVVV